MLNWSPQGAIAARALYDLSTSPIEEGRDVLADNQVVAERLERDLMAYLKAGNAEKTVPPRRRAKPRK